MLSTSNLGPLTNPHDLNWGREILQVNDIVYLYKAVDNSKSIVKIYEVIPGNQAPSAQYRATEWNEKNKCFEGEQFLSTNGSYDWIKLAPNRDKVLQPGEWVALFLNDVYHCLDVYLHGQIYYYDNVDYSWVRLRSPESMPQTQRVEAIKNGFHCKMKHCNYFNPDAVANTPEGEYICFNCRS